MALTLGVPVFVLGHIHDETGDGPNGGMGSGTVNGAVLLLLVVSFPAPSQLGTGALAVLRQVDESAHLALLNVALQGEIAAPDEQERGQRHGYNFGRL